MEQRTESPGGLWPEASVLLRALGPEMLELMDGLSATLFCAKDPSGRYVAVNQRFVDRTGERSRRTVIGARVHDLFENPLADHYAAQDRGVLETGRPLRNELELIRRAGGAGGAGGSAGSGGWYLSSKLPVRVDGVVVGLVNVSEDLRTYDTADVAVSSLSRVVALVHERFAGPLAVADLAAAAGCSPSTLDRRMHKVFALSPQQFVLRVRIDHAAALLTRGELPITQIATESGFYDQAVFTRTFGRLTGDTPAQFRRRTRLTQPPG